MHLRRALKWVLLAALLLPTVTIGYFLYPVIPDPEPGFQARKGELVSKPVTRHWLKGVDQFEELTLTSSSGLQVEITVRRPQAINHKLPAMILLGGQGTGRRGVVLVNESYPVIAVGVSYPYHGDLNMRGLALLRNIDYIQQAELDITPAILLTLDYLLTRADVDPRHVELVGVSLGAFFVSMPGAIDTRFTRVWLVQGGGDPKAIFDDRLRTRIASDWWRDKFARLIFIVFNEHHFAPERWVGRIAPRPVIVVNSRGDAAFPPGSVEVLHHALGQPHEIVWIEGEHVRPTLPNVIKQLSEVVVSRIAEQSAPATGSTVQQ